MLLQPRGETLSFRAHLPSVVCVCVASFPVSFKRAAADARCRDSNRAAQKPGGFGTKILNANHDLRDLLTVLGSHKHILTRQSLRLRLYESR